MQDAGGRRAPDGEVFRCDAAHRVRKYSTATDGRQPPSPRRRPHHTKGTATARQRAAQAPRRARMRMATRPQAAAATLTTSRGVGVLFPGPKPEENRFIRPLRT